MTRPRLLTRVAIGIGLCCGVALAAQDVAGEFALEQMAAGLSALPGASLGALWRDAGTGRIVLRDLRVGREGWTVSVGRLAVSDGLRIPSLVAPAAAAADAGRVVADDIVVTGRRHRYRVPHLELRGTRLSLADIATLLDPAAPGTVVGRLGRLTAAVVTAPSATMELDAFRTERPGPVITAHDLALVDVVGGRIGALTAQHLDVVQPGAAPSSGLVTGELRADLLDLPLALRLAETDRVAPDAALGILFASASVSAVDLHPEGGTGRLTIAALRSGAVRARPLPATVDATSALLRQKLDALDPAERRSLVDGLADLTQSYEVDHVGIDEVRFDDGEPRPRRLALARLALDGIGARRSASVTLEGLALDSPEAAMNLDHAAVWGLDPSVAVALARRAVETDGPGLGGARAAVGSARTAAAIDGLRIVAPSTDGTGNSPDGSSILVEVPEAGAESGAATAGGALTTSFHGRLIFPLPSTTRDPNLQGLAGFGLTRLEVTAGEALSLDQSDQHLSVDDLSVGVAQLGTLAVAAAFGHVDPSAYRWDGSSEAGERAAARIALESLSIRFVDAGLVEKSLPRLAASAGLSVPVFKASLKAQAAVAIAQALGDAPAAAQLNAALTAFLDDPHNIGLSIKVPGGLTLAAAQAAEDAASLLRRVEVEAYANR